jgi:hypothetical protein
VIVVCNVAQGAAEGTVSDVCARGERVIGAREPRQRIHDIIRTEENATDAALPLGSLGDLAEVEEVQDAVEEEEGATVTVPRAAGTKILSVIPAPTPSVMREATGDQAIKLNLTKCGGGGGMSRRQSRRVEAAAARGVVVICFNLVARH